MNCIIIDDEPLAIEGIKLHLKNIPGINLLETFENALNARDFMMDYEVDLIFLDIQMPKITGLEFLKVLSNKPMIIITTAYQQYAVEGFELDVLDYLLKPISFERLLKAVSKAQELMQTKSVLKMESQKNDFVFIRSDRKFIKLFYKDITYIEGLKDYILIYTKTGKVITRMNMKTIMMEFPPELFFRINKSYIVNIDQITEVDNDLVRIGQKELTIGNSYKKEFYDKIINTKIVKK